MASKYPWDWLKGLQNSLSLHTWKDPSVKQIQASSNYPQRVFEYLLGFIIIQRIWTSTPPIDPQKPFKGPLLTSSSILQKGLHIALQSPQHPSRP
ncbi:hypothetical protein O181_053660 [Austropuccinia psidii MF-1]|uniref:Uncharacterized protein n=1 Tax=Austropuccinia psidii MF-1 TaxID=1389203 RepID=A0A9Q3E109_9BASI|nr:hypothetical protein [Austropuccinia psidii MF-1]